MPPKFERPRLGNPIPHYVAYKMYFFRSMCNLRMTMSHCFLFFICLFPDTPDDLIKSYHMFPAENIV